eukprot:scaffold61393_cov98-Phaeocystis_antarctica.AAC.2
MLDPPASKQLLCMGGCNAVVGVVHVVRLVVGRAALGLRGFVSSSNEGTDSMSESSGLARRERGCGSSSEGSAAVPRSRAKPVRVCTVLGYTVQDVPVRREASRPPAASGLHGVRVRQCIRARIKRKKAATRGAASGEQIIRTLRL